MRIYRNHGEWGNRIAWTNWNSRQVHGWVLPRPREGDLLHWDMESGRTAVFRFTEVEHCRDPQDMFFGTVEDVGYVDEHPEHTTVSDS